MNLAKKLWMTTGGSSGGVVPSGEYVDDLFSTYLYTGNGSTQTINNGIDLAGEGGLVWIKGRSGATDHALYDTARGVTLDLVSNSTAGQITQSTGLTTFGNSGFSVGSLAKLNTNSSTYASWTFRKAPKFFDVVTYTGNGVAGRQIAHNLGVAPGMVIVKATDHSSDWKVWHRSLPDSYFLELDSTTAQVNSTSFFGINSTQTDSVFTIGNLSGAADHVNGNGNTYVAYLFAHDPSADGIIQCGSFTGNTTVNIGWEPQWIMIKRTDATGNWIVIDSMRGCSVGGVDAVLNPNLLNAESVSNDYIDFTATGFITKNLTGTHIYTVISRPNKPPTIGTQVYNAIARTGTGAVATVTGAGFAPDLTITTARSIDPRTHFHSRLIGAGKTLQTCSSIAEALYPNGITAFTSDGITLGAEDAGQINTLPIPMIDHFFRRAPGFMDIVCDTGTGAAHAIVHNLTKAPELIIRKSRSVAGLWEVWHSALTATEKLVLNSNTSKATDTAAWNSVLPTATQFTVGTGANVNANATTFVTYLFATLAGISKVGSYSGNGGTQTIPCGFTTGSRFILIKRIDNTGDWFVWDTARGITPTTDPHLSLNTTAAEVTTDDSIDQDASGFVVNQNAATNINALGGNYLFLAIA